jgi:hypothetical protein
VLYNLIEHVGKKVSCEAHISFTAKLMRQSGVQPPSMQDDHEIIRSFSEVGENGGIQEKYIVAEKIYDGLQYNGKCIPRATIEVNYIIPSNVSNKKRSDTLRLEAMEN